jgi:hypothetical protein
LRSPLLAETGDERTLPLSLANGFHEKASLVKVNVVTKASTIQDKTPFRYTSIRTPFEPALQWLSA